MLVLGQVSQAKLQGLKKEILNLILQQNPKSVDSQFLEIKLIQVAVLHNITKEPITKILYTYSCTQCDLEDDQVKDSVKSALQTFNLKEYQAETTDKKVVNSDKNNTGLLVGVVAAILLVLVITSVGVWHYKRKMHKRSKGKEMELEMNGHTNRALNIGDSEDVATFRNPDYNSNRRYKEPNGHYKL